MKQFKIEKDTNNPIAIIVTRSENYSKLIQKLSHELANEGCVVETQEFARPRSIHRAQYLIYLGFPDKEEKRVIRNSMARRIVIAVDASLFSDSQKQNAKKFPVVFLPKNFSTRLEWTTDNILQVLFTQPDRQKVEESALPAGLAAREKSRQEKRKEYKEDGKKKIDMKSRSVQWKVRRKISELGSEIYEKEVKKSKSQKVSPQRAGGLNLTSHISHRTSHKNLVEKRSHLKSLLMKSSLIVFLTVIGLSLFYPYLIIQQTKNNLQLSLNALQQTNFTKAKTHALKARAAIVKIQSLYKIANPFISTVVPKESQDIDAIFQAVNQSITAINTSSELGSSGNDFITRLLNHQPVLVQQETNFFSEHVKLLQEELTELETTLQALEESRSWLARTTQKFSGDYQNKLPETLVLLDKARTVIPLLPDVLAAKDRKKYLVLFQNNMELRPTGGFIGSVGFLRLEGGKMLELNIEDVYSLDGQLEGHVEPPLPLKNYLGEPNWFLRDANWDPDFSRSADQIQWFLRKEIQTGVDGVIALDLEFAKRVLATLGGITVPDTNIRVTPDNLYLQTQTYSEKDFFPGSTSKRDFLGSLARSMLIEISIQDTTPTMQLMSAINSSLAEKHILLNFNSDTVQQAFDNFGWTGRLLQPECQIDISTLPRRQAGQPSTGCIVDFLMTVDANLGVNKVNFFVERLTKLNISLEKNRLRRILTLSYSNHSTSDKFPGGMYKNYLRILIPPNAILESISINNTNFDVSQVDRKPVGEYQGLGVLLEIPSGSSKTIMFTYSTPISLEDSSGYELLVQKQPGTANPSLILSIESEIGTKLEAHNFIPLVREDGLLYNTTLNTDKIFKVKIL